MSTFFKGLALFVLIATATWVAVLWHWERSHRDVDSVDIVLYLAVLPFAGFVLALLLRSGWHAAQQRSAAGAAGAAAPAAAPAAGSGGAPAAGPDDGAGERERHLALQVLGMQCQLLCGATASEVDTALAEGRLRPQPDAELRNEAGLPVMTARLPDLDPDAQRASCDGALALLRRQREAWQALEPSPAFWRALAALQAPIEQALLALQPWHGPLGLDDEGPARTTPSRPSEAAPLHLLLALPAHTHALELALAQDWVQAQCRSARIPPERLAVQVFAAAETGEAWQRAESLALALHRRQQAGLLLVAAAHSDIDEHLTAELGRQGRLFDAERRPRGLMPGEGAVVLLLASEGWPAAPDAPETAVQIHRAGQFRRSQSVEANGKAGHAELLKACEEALARARVEAGGVAAIVTDADQHSARSAECFGAALALTPHLDAGEDVRVLGATLGHTGVVGALVALGLAAEAVRKQQRPALAFSAADPVVRLAWVARPPVWPPAGEGPPGAPAAAAGKTS